MDRFFLFLAFLLGALYSIAAKEGEPPQPNPAGKNNSDMTAFSVPPPVGLPIDENIIILVIIALLFGIYIIYNHRLKTKAPI